MSVDPFCTSSYLGLRYVAREGASWKDGYAPRYPADETQQLTPVATGDHVLGALKAQMDRIRQDATVGILLSGGIDSAILAAMMEPGARAYTIRFAAAGAVDESPMARAFAEHCGLRHRTVVVTLADQKREMDSLMLRKKSPLHAVEVALYQAARAAAGDGVRTLVVGNGADSTFGGLDRLLSVDWTFDAFIDRYTFVDPSAALHEPRSLRSVFEPYRRAEHVDVVQFLKVVHGKGIVQAFDNAIGAAGVKTYEPYETLELTAPLDLARIRKGESKYLLRDIFGRLYPGWELPSKIAFARPLDAWLADWKGPARPEFLAGLRADRWTGEQKWLLYCLDRFLELVDGDAT
jgi:asparagine synthetase B (glutamine-hydrolysing)